MIFINATDALGKVINAASTDMTGSIFITLLIIVIIICAFAIAFGISLEYTVILVIPLLIAAASQYSDFVAVLGVGLIYISAILAKAFLFR